MLLLNFLNFSLNTLLLKKHSPHTYTGLYGNSVVVGLDNVPYKRVL